MAETVRMADRGVAVFVRKGDRKDERNLSFRRPPDIPQRDILTSGMALDGNAVLCGIAFDDGIPAYRHPNVKMKTPTDQQRDLAEILDLTLRDRDEEEEPVDGEPEPIAPDCSRMGHQTLAEALNCIEAQLAVWLHAYGYTPVFE